MTDRYKSVERDIMDMNRQVLIYEVMCSPVKTRQATKEELIKAEEQAKKQIKLNRIRKKKAVTNYWIERQSRIYD